MALIGIDPDEIFEFVSKHEKDLESPTVFKLGVIDSLTIAKIEDNLTVFTIDPKDTDAKTDTKMSTGKREVELVKAGLKGWDNFKDKKGNDIPFEVQPNRSQSQGKTVDIPKESTLKRIPKIILTELANELYNQNKLDEVERKNSE